MTHAVVDNDDAIVTELREQFFGDDITPEQVAAILGLDRSTIMRYLREGELLGYQVGRTWYVPRLVVAAYRQKLIDRQQHQAARQKTIGSGMAIGNANVWFADGEWRSEIKDVLSEQDNAPLQIDLITASLVKERLPDYWEGRALISIEHGDREVSLPLDDLLDALTVLKSKWEELFA